MELGKAFNFVIEDDQWLATLLIGGLLCCVPIFGWFVLLGFMLETARNVMRGSERPLPRWDNIGEKFTLGLYGFAIQLVYALPALLLMFVFACLFIVMAAASRGNEGGLVAIFALFAFCGLPVVAVVSLVPQPFMWAAHARFLQTGSLSAAFRFAEIIALTRANLGTWVVVWLLYLLCLVIAQLGTVVFFIGLLLSIPYSQAVFGHLLGQAAAPRGAQSYSNGPPPPMYQ